MVSECRLMIAGGDVPLEICRLLSRAERLSQFYWWVAMYSKVIN
jgi:hypothetical protein